MTLTQISYIVAVDKHQHFATNIFRNLSIDELELVLISFQNTSPSC